MSLLLSDINDFLRQRYMGEPVRDYIWFAGIVLATLLVKNPLANVLTRVSSTLAAKFTYMRHKDTIREMLFKPIERLVQTVLFYVACTHLNHLMDNITVLQYRMGKKNELEMSLGEVVNHTFLFLFIIFFTQVVSAFINFIYYLRMGKAQLEKNHAREQLLPLMKEMAKLVLWILAIFWILGAVFHVNIPALITGLGIGGIAIALAGKQTVENFFAAFTILSDRPFQSGDTIKLGEVEGTVERIGFRSTRVRTSEGAAYIIPNQHLIDQNLVNLSMRDTRGMKITVNVRYGITHEKLEQLFAEIAETLRNTAPVTDPIETFIEAFDKETFQLVVTYHLPHPLPHDMKLTGVKRDINLKVFGVVSKYAMLGVTTPGV
jgi:MscS family membrane protein